MPDIKYNKFINININAQSEQKDEEVEVCAQSLIRPGLGQGRWVCVKKDLSVSCKWLVVTFELLTQAQNPSISFLLSIIIQRSRNIFN